MSFLKNVIRETGNKYGSIVAEGVDAADVSGYVDTGSYIFNCLVTTSSLRAGFRNEICKLLIK